MRLKFALKTKNIHAGRISTLVKTDGISNLNFEEKTTLTFLSSISKEKVANILNIEPNEIQVIKAENQTNFQETQICIIESPEMSTDEKSPFLGRKIEAPKISQITPENVEVFIEDLTYVKDLNAFHSDKELIYSALRNSELTRLFRGMNENQRSNLSEFSKFLRGLYGLSDHELFLRLNRIKQEKDENECQFLSRVTRAFTELKGSKADNLSENEKNEIRHVFISGLGNIKAKRQLLMNEASISFEKLGATAQNYCRVLGNDQETVHFIENDYNQHKELIKKIEDLTVKVDQISFRQNQNYQNQIYRRGDYDKRQYNKQKSYNRNYHSRSPSRERGRSLSFYCYKCGTPGHKEYQCHASTKTIVNFRKRLERQNERSRDRDRNQSQSHSNRNRYHSSPDHSDNE